jgi:hypothetical protein
LGFKPFSDFLGSRSDLVDLDESGTTRMVRLHSDTPRSSRTPGTPSRCTARVAASMTNKFESHLQ